MVSLGVDLTRRVSVLGHGRVTIVNTPSLSRPECQTVLGHHRITANMQLK